jgi:hypothetical protein
MKVNERRLFYTCIQKYRQHITLTNVVLSPSTPESMQETRISRVVVGASYTSQHKADFEYDIGYLAANKNFTYGGHFTEQMRIFILPMMPAGFAFTLQTEITYDNKRYRVEDFTEFTCGYIVQAVHVPEISPKKAEVVNVTS